MLKRLLMVLFTMSVLVAGSATVASASPSPVKVTAYPGVTINYNSKVLSGSNQPYIINNVTYVPFRLLMENFGKNVSWDAANYQVLITDGTSAKELELYNQIADLKNKNAELEKTIASLNTQVTTLQASADTDDISTGDLKETLEDYFSDAGDDYFGDDGINFTYSLSGDEDDLVYTIKIDFDDADDYEDLTEVSTSYIQSFLSAVKSKINSEVYDTDFEDADITGKLVDNDNSSNYVTYNGSSYTYSWSDDDIDDVEETVVDYFDDLDVGDYYFADDGVEVTITVDGDEDNIAYRVKIDCSDSDYTDISEINSTRLTAFLKALKSKITSEINDTDFEDADITGLAYDVNSTSLKVTFDGSSYDYSW